MKTTGYETTGSVHTYLILSSSIETFHKVPLGKIALEPGLKHRPLGSLGFYKAGSLMIVIILQ